MAQRHKYSEEKTEEQINAKIANLDLFDSSDRKEMVRLLKKLPVVRKYDRRRGRWVSVENNKGKGNFEPKDPSCIGKDGEPKAPNHRDATLRSQARGANNVPANKRNSGQIIKEMWNAFYAFDYAAFEAIQKSVDLKNPEIKAVVERIESHPSWGKSHTIHEKIIAQKEKQEREAWQREMEYDALHGLHHKHANTFFGKVIFDPEYREVCNRLGIIPQLTKVT